MNKIDISYLEDIVCQNIEIILNDLNLEMKQYGNRLESPCFFHNGDNNHALNLYLDKNRFYCHTRQCHLAVYNTVVGFVRLALSSKLINWFRVGDPLYSFR